MCALLVGLFWLVSRGEQISAIWFVVVALCSYAIAYRFYAYYIQIKIMRTDDANATPAERVHDGANFERADRRVLFGQHFAAFPVRARLLVLFWQPKWATCRL